MPLPTVLNARAGPPRPARQLRPKTSCPPSSEADGIDESDQRLPNSQRRPQRGRFSSSCEKQAATAERQTAAPPITSASLPTVALNGHMQALGSLKLCPCGAVGSERVPGWAFSEFEISKISSEPQAKSERIGTTAIWPSPDVSAVMPRPPMK